MCCFFYQECSSPAGFQGRLLLTVDPPGGLSHLHSLRFPPAQHRFSSVLTPVLEMIYLAHCLFPVCSPVLEM